MGAAEAAEHVSSGETVNIDGVGFAWVSDNGEGAWRGISTWPRSKASVAPRVWDHQIE
jgi:hypothetical protein